MSNKICAVVVTYNRLKLLKECLSHLEQQTRKPDEIIIINNGSSDGTTDWLEGQSSFTVVNQENSGSAGGQNTGIKLAYEKGYDWIWCIDDDGIPKPDALEKLENFTKMHCNVGFVCSRVLSSDGNEMNVPLVDLRTEGNFYPNWAQLLNEKAVKVQFATFVSIMFNRKAVQQCGYPIRDLFIWGDDSNYTFRITREFDGYLLGESVVIHKRELTAQPCIFTEKEKRRILFHYYGIRNQIFHIKNYESRLFLFKYIVLFLIKSVNLLRTEKYVFLRFSTYFRGLLSGLFFNSKIEYPNQ